MSPRPAAAIMIASAMGYRMVRKQILPFSPSFSLYPVLPNPVIQLSHGIISTPGVVRRDKRFGI